MVTLAAQGIGVAPGEPFGTRPDSGHIRITVGLHRGTDADLVALADLVAAAAAGPGPGRRPRT